MAFASVDHGGQLSMALPGRERGAGRAKPQNPRKRYLPDLTAGDWSAILRPARDSYYPLPNRGAAGSRYAVSLTPCGLFVSLATRLLPSGEGPLGGMAAATA